MSAERVREYYRRQGEARELQRIIEAITEYNELHGMEDYLFEELLLTISPLTVRVQSLDNTAKNDWQDDDVVTTTYGSIQLSLQQAHSAGVKTERERIIALLQERGLKLEKEVSDEDSYSYGRHDEIVFVIDLLTEVGA